MKSKIKLVIFDLDNTLTKGPTIWEQIHRQMGTWKTHGIKYLENFNNGLFNFNTFIKKDVACWKDLPVAKLKKAIAKVSYIPHIKKTILALKKKKIKTALISSSLESFAKDVAKKFGIDYVFANTLEIKKNKLTGKVKLKVPGNGKGQITKYLMKCLQLKKKEAVAVGDSMFDIAMFKKVGMSITFTDANPDIKSEATYMISKQDLFRIIKKIEDLDS